LPSAEETTPLLVRDASEDELALVCGEMGEGVLDQGGTKEVRAPLVAGDVEALFV
jgi:hypothetical protein